jgi:hypothetical protein
MSMRLREALLPILTLKVRFLSEEQLSRAFWEGNPRTAARYLYELRARGLVRRALILSHPEIALSGPLLTWKPGEPVPNFERASYACKKRWVSSPVRLPVWLATARAARIFGGTAGEVRLATATHDLHAGALYLRLRGRETGDLRLVREDFVRQEPGERLPDFVLADAHNCIHHAFEFGGAAKPERIQKLHSYAEYFAIPYELW